MKTIELTDTAKVESHGNKYETFREQVKATVRATAIKVRDRSTSYEWSVGKIISACADACGLPIKDTPEDFKRIVKFEMGKLRDEVHSTGYEHARSKEDYLFKEGQMKGRLTETFYKFLPLEKQLSQAIAEWSRLSVKADDPQRSAEQRNATRKRMHVVQVAIDHCRAEIERQNALKAEAAALTTEAKAS